MDLIVTTREDLEQMINEAVTKAFAQFRPPVPREVTYNSVAETAKKAGCAPLTIYRGVQNGTIPSKRIGSLIKIPSSYLEQ